MELVESWILELGSGYLLPTGLTSWSHTVFKFQRDIMQSLCRMLHEGGHDA